MAPKQKAVDFFDLMELPPTNGTLATPTNKGTRRKAPAPVQTTEQDTIFPSSPTSSKLTARPKGKAKAGTKVADIGEIPPTNVAPRTASKLKSTILAESQDSFVSDSETEKREPMPSRYSVNTYTDSDTDSPQ